MKTINSIKQKHKTLTVSLTIVVQGDLVTLHPGWALCPQLRPDSARVYPILTDGDVETGEVTLKGGDVHAARSVDCEWCAVGKTNKHSAGVTDLIAVASVSGVFVMTSHKMNGSKTLIQYRNIMCSDTVSILKNIIDFIFNSLQAKIHGSRKTVIITLCAGLLSDFSWRVSCQRWQANKSVCYFTLAVFHFILGLVTQSVNVAPPLTEALQLCSRFLEALMTRHSRSAAQVLCSGYSACC